MSGLDRRINPVRDDLAAEHLRGRVDAGQFVAGVDRSVALGCTALRRNPGHDAALDTQLLRGETVCVYEEKDGWAWVQNATDRYVGYVECDALGPLIAAPSHRLTALRSYVYPTPDLKAPPRDLWSIGSVLKVAGERGSFSEIAEGGWIHSGHLTPVDNYADDPVAIALEFLGTPYLWGGRTSIGLDCSALIQLSLAICGESVPRDSDLQAQEIGNPVSLTDGLGSLRRGDLVYWPGHAGIWIDDNAFLHANATDMKVSVAPLAEVSAHIRRVEGVEISAIRRPVSGIS